MSEPPGGAGALRCVLSCEHASWRIPPEYRALFVGHEALLASHRGYDAGALVLARALARAQHAPLIAARASRLLIDCNRSPGHPRLYSEIMDAAPRRMRQEVYARYYLAYRQQVEQEIAAALATGARVVHISSHSFTPVFDGVARNADLGLLYDPRRAGEVALCRAWIAALRRRAPEVMPALLPAPVPEPPEPVPALAPARRLRLRRNYPYLGRADGLCTWLRRHYPAERYIGVELEVNQRHVAAGGRPWRRLCADIVAALAPALKALPPPGGSANA